MHPFFRPALLVLGLMSVAAGQAQPAYDMGRYHLVLLFEGAHVVSPDTLTAHQAHVERLVTEGVVATSGSVSDASLREVLVVRTDSMAHAQQVAASLPAVRAGGYRAEVLGWFVARNMLTAPSQPRRDIPYAFCLLLTGPNANQEAQEARRLQDGHMANIQRLADEGALVLAGPLVDARPRRGVFIFSRPVEEALALSAT
ncbi:MAG TPA: hypothetical protein VD948_10840, partial [Rhodothermales bacterium]|nr:hypothetical protein [Rhodothermales bacterium]